MTAERRLHERFTVVDLVLYDQESQRPVGKVVNISARGLLVITTKLFDLGKRHSFYIPFSKTIQGLVKFEFVGEIKWGHTDEDNASHFSIGMEFAENPELQTMFIQQLVKIYGAS